MHRRVKLQSRYLSFSSALSIAGSGVCIGHNKNMQSCLYKNQGTGPQALVELPRRDERVFAVRSTVPDIQLDELRLGVGKERPTVVRQ
jgi:hypothetical protein